MNVRALFCDECYDIFLNHGETASSVNLVEKLENHLQWYEHTI